MSNTISSTFFFPSRYYEWDISNPSLLARQYKIVEYIGRLTTEAARLHRCLVSASDCTMTPTHDPNCLEVAFSITVTGTAAQVLAARGFMLRKSISEHRIFITTSTALVLTSNGTALRPYFIRALQSIMKEMGVRITCYGHTGDEPPAAARSLAGANVEIIEIVGVLEVVERARVKTMVLLDELAGLQSDSLVVDAKLHYIIAGRKRLVLESLMRNTLTNIMLPSPVGKMLSKGDERATPESDTDAATIWITGDPSGILRAKEALLSQVRQKSPVLITKTIQSLSRRLDWMLLHRRERLLKIMYDNAVYLQFPALGTASNVVTVIGDKAVYVARATRAFLQLACEFYTAYIHLADASLSPPHILTPSSSKPAIINVITERIGYTTQVLKADLVYRGSILEIYGVAQSVKDSFRLLTDMDVIKPLIRDTKFHMELGLEHKEFILGKKNGKTNKIVKASGCRVAIQEQINDQNMLLEITSVSPQRTLDGLQLLEDELPAELSFYIPEVFHKRIIGVGGKNIQRIMKKYGVYVKFSNMEEYMGIGGYFENQDNVIARTPAKNAFNLEELKTSVMELVPFNERADFTTSVYVPRHYHRMVVGPTGHHLMDILTETKVEITIPDRESGNDIWTIMGLNGAVEHAKQRILYYMPEMFEIIIPATSAARTVLVEHEFKEQVIDRLIREHGAQVLCHMPKELIEEPANFRIMIYHYTLCRESLEPVRRIVREYLGSKQVSLQPQTQPATRSSSFAKLPTTTSYDSFRHFDCKLLAPVPNTTKIPTDGVLGVSSIDVGGSSNTGTAYSLFSTRGAFKLGAIGDSSSGQQGGHLSPSPSLHSSVSASPIPKYGSVAGPSGRTLNTGHSLPDLHAYIDAKPFVPSGYGVPGILAAAEQYGMRRSQSFQGPDVSLMASAARGGSRAIWDAPTQLIKSHSASSIPIFSHTEDPLIIHRAPENRARYDGSTVAAYNAPRYDLLNDTDIQPVSKVPNGEFCGMSLSKSMGQLVSFGMLDDIPRLRPRSTLRENFSSESDSESEVDAIMNKNIIDQIFNMDGVDGNKVTMLLKSIDLSKYAHIFLSQDVDFQMMLELTESDLKELGIKTLGSRGKILTAINEYKATQMKTTLATAVVPKGNDGHIQSTTVITPATGISPRPSSALSCSPHSSTSPQSVTNGISKRDSFGPSPRASLEAPGRMSYARSVKGH
ncbi:hypothetical protein SeLEV6574_g06945 [Synchytrium endobioticum]|uniref:SAM domain-containing protein n=2 Tax=Synchytrium endobioticum TaxID=286115 RepID=A0A507CJE0_9FUNG|nr:hypothetical protein SeLEV6574_g06945 [Synchytrium endobioticum]